MEKFIKVNNVVKFIKLDARKFGDFPDEYDIWISVDKIIRLYFIKNRCENYTGISLLDMRDVYVKETPKQIFALIAGSDPANL